jgi:hypothetical protein
VTAIGAVAAIVRWLEKKLPANGYNSVPGKWNAKAE